MESAAKKNAPGATGAAPPGVTVVGGGGGAAPKAEEDAANPLSRLTWGYVLPLFIRGQNHTLKTPDILQLPARDGADVLGAAFDDALRRTTVDGVPNVGGAIKSLYMRRWLWAGFLKWCNSTLQFAPPIVFNLLLQQLTEVYYNVPLEKRVYAPYMGWLLAGLLAGLNIVRACIENHVRRRRARAWFGAV